MSISSNKLHLYGSLNFSKLSLKFKDEVFKRFNIDVKRVKSTHNPLNIKALIIQKKEYDRITKRNGLYWVCFRSNRLLRY